MDICKPRGETDDVIPSLARSKTRIQSSPTKVLDFWSAVCNMLAGIRDKIAKVVGIQWLRAMLFVMIMSVSVSVVMIMAVPVIDKLITLKMSTPEYILRAEAAAEKSMMTIVQMQETCVGETRSEIQVINKSDGTQDVVTIGFCATDNRWRQPMPNARDVIGK